MMVRVGAALAALLVSACLTEARPLVRNIKTNAEFNKLLKHHKEVTGFPVIVDYYSDGCGPCRQIAPIYKKLAKQYKGKVVFTKVDVNYNRETSGAQMIRSMPTFQFYYLGKKKHQFSGGDPNSLQQWAEKLAQKSAENDVEISKEAMLAFYKEHAPDKEEAAVLEIYGKLTEGGGPSHAKLLKKLKKKYDGKGPEVVPATSRMPKEDAKKKEEKAKGPTLATSTTEELQAELDRRLEAEADAKAEAEEAEDAPEPEALIKMYAPGDFPERVVVIGAGPAGLAAAIYAARAGLRPVVVAPPMGGQLQGKGVMVENYPGLAGLTGPVIVGDMMNQAAEFGTTFEQNMVEEVDFAARPFTIKTNFTTIKTHTVILATGADSKWLGIDGEQEFRGGGVSSCATCDGFLYREQEVVVIGGGDTAMEDALVLARTSSKVTVIHRRDAFRASHVLAERVLQNDKITVRWNATTVKFEGETVQAPGDEEGTTVDMEQLTKVHIKDVSTGEISTISCAAAFVAIGHSPNTGIVSGKLNMDKTGYVIPKGDGSTYTSIEGIFAAGDVSDSVYRQAITSAGSGAMAALDAERWLSEQGIGDEAAEFEAEMMRELLEETEEREVGSDYPDAYVEPKKEEPKEAEAEAEPAKASDDAEEEEEVVEEDDGVEVVDERDEL